MMNWRAALTRLLHRPDEPMFVDLTDVTRKRQVREAEYQAALDQQSAIVRRSSDCQRLQRRSLSGLVERVRGRL